jgi:hypothetical protein
LPLSSSQCPFSMQLLLVESLTEYVSLLTLLFYQKTFNTKNGHMKTYPKLQMYEVVVKKCFFGFLVCQEY